MDNFDEFDGEEEEVDYDFNLDDEFLNEGRLLSAVLKGAEIARCGRPWLVFGQQSSACSPLQCWKPTGPEMICGRTSAGLEDEKDKGAAESKQGAKPDSKPHSLVSG